jgi:hypothetical protein
MPNVRRVASGLLGVTGLTHARSRRFGAMTAHRAAFPNLRPAPGRAEVFLWRREIAMERSATVRPTMHRFAMSILFLPVGVVLMSPGSAFGDPWADQVMNYNAGVNPEPGYTSNANVVLGSPERVTGEVHTFPFPSDVTMFNSPYGFDEIISIGAGGELVVRFDEPIADNPANAFGVDLIVFGNTFFTTSDFVAGNITGDNREPATVEVSSDGANWLDVTPAADSLFPTQAFTDSFIFGTDGNFEPSGTMPTDYLKPVDPSLTIADFLGLTYAEALALYDGGGGGTPIDIGHTGLASASFVRISVPEGAGHSAEIDAFAVVPEPASCGLVWFAAMLAAARRRRR